jgi:hypothetical protein
MSDDIRAAVASILEEAGVTYSVMPRGVAPRALDGNHPMDQWLCTFALGGILRDFDFFTGIGLREPATRFDRMKAAYGFPGLTEKDKKGATAYGRRYLAEVEKLRKPKAPHAADVLYNLLLDSSAMQMSFDEWCDDYGYDNDSRKAEGIFDTCRVNARALAEVIRADVRAALSDVLQEY